MADQEQKGQEPSERETQEAEIIAALRSIHPFALVITKPTLGGYKWEYLESYGIAPTLARVVKHGLDYAMMYLLRHQTEPEPEQEAASADDQGDINLNFGSTGWYYNPREEGK